MMLGYGQRSRQCSEYGWAYTWACSNFSVGTTNKWSYVFTMRAAPYPVISRVAIRFPISIPVSYFFYWGAAIQICPLFWWPEGVNQLLSQVCYLIIGVKPCCRLHFKVRMHNCLPVKEPILLSWKKKAERWDWLIWDTLSGNNQGSMIILCWPTLWSQEVKTEPIAKERLVDKSDIIEII